MRSITRKLWSIITQAQMLVIFLAFALMVVLSYLYVSDVQRKHLWTLAQDTIAHTEVNIKSDLLEPETFLGGIAETIRVMILQGKTLDEVWDYLNNITEYVTTNEQFAYATGVYGFFDVFGGKFCNSIGWIPPDDYVPQSRPWYIAAEEADGKVGTTEPYLLVSLQTVAITFARRIFDDDGNPLGVVCLDIRLDRIRQYAVETQFAEKGYGFLLSRDFTVIAHPNPSMVGIVLADQKSGIADFANELKQTGFISERISTDYRGIKSIVYIGRLYNGWYMGIVTPRDTYYKTTRNLMVMLSALGTVLAVILSLILLRIISAKIKADTLAAEVVELEKRKADIAEESNKTKSDFLARVSHEIRTPLNAILGIAEIQLHDDKLADNARDAFGRVSNSGSLLLAIINDILDLSKIEAGKMELLPAKYEVASLIHDTAQLNLIRYESKPIIFSLHIGENIPTMLVGDELRIKQILNNILSNAFKYTEKGEVKLSVSAEPMGGEDESDIMILIFSVTDTGQGMTAEQIERLGDSYSRFNMEANRLTVGTGLGMTIAKTLILLMDGQISIKSEPGKGSTFTVRLPQWTTGSSQTISRELADNLSKFRINSLSQLNKSEMKREFMP
ncbi:MAG: hypothetical protein LBH44_06105 [Treponema sp.]|jgi:signal transduction histidine kinase|nr:hypothetical protein [Treponema sp.]